ncbi:hypothetical protein BGW38_004905 [Lunasporangiospora selenospora]|uniref:Uncharacterized protein n=1 Tax=Lunasporangiospora selenospora TaxID=979761 RepID=A0A9P6KGN2_9FUNG|nr:hypothetical protein BGW38_004905 [Lunasporangiospora selenospora]
MATPADAATAAATVAKTQQQDIHDESVLAELDVAPGTKPVVPPHLLARLQQLDSPDKTHQDIDNKLAEAEERRKKLEVERVQKAAGEVTHAKMVSERTRQEADVSRDESIERMREKHENAERARQEQERARLSKLEEHSAKVASFQKDDQIARDAEIREIKDKLEQAEERRKALEEEKIKKLEEHQARVKQVREADSEAAIAQYEQQKAELDQKMKAAEQRRIDLETALKEKIQARQVQAEQVRQRQRSQGQISVEGVEGVETN